MVSISASQFVHRDNHDGSFDSICRECFRTVATVKWEAELDKAERAHTCAPQELARIAELKDDADLRNRARPCRAKPARLPRCAA